MQASGSARFAKRVLRVRREEVARGWFRWVVSVGVGLVVWEGQEGVVGGVRLWEVSVDTTGESEGRNTFVVLSFRSLKY